MKIVRDILLENGTKRETAASVTKAVGDDETTVLGFAVHTKASEKYVVVSYRRVPDARQWVIPYQYRRTNVFIDDLDSLVELIQKSKFLLNQDAVAAFKRSIEPHLEEFFGAKATVTLPIFRTLLENCGEWVWSKSFNNENPQRRIQDIKETGFTLATKFENRAEGHATYHMLLPFPRVKASTYETIPAPIRRKIFAIHNGIDAYSGQKASTSCLPDHKFPEIRWDTDTPKSNADLTEQEMQEKFQLVPEHVNQRKREVCRKCFQSGERGMLNGIRFFYRGTSKWDETIPKTSRSAEAGCVGCFWYDMEAWRRALHERLGVEQ